MAGASGDRATACLLVRGCTQKAQRGTARITASLLLWSVFAAAPVPARTPGHVHREAAVALVASHGAAARGWAPAAVRVYAEVDRRMRRLGSQSRARVARTILEEASRAGVDPLVVVAVIRVESSFDPGAVSPAGAVGLMQLLVPTMREEEARSRLAMGDPRDPAANVRAGVRYLRRLVVAFVDVDLALMAYNAGPARIRRHLRAGAIPARLLAYARTVDMEASRMRVPGDPGAGGELLACAPSRVAPARSEGWPPALAPAVRMASEGTAASPARDASRSAIPGRHDGRSRVAPASPTQARGRRAPVRPAARDGETRV